MTPVIANMSMSLDGFVADSDEPVDVLLGWYGAGPIATPTANPGVTFRTSQRDAEHVRAEMAGVGALITGRHLFDYAQGWGGRHPLGVPVFVVTHRPPPDDWPVSDPPFTFITGGITDAVTQAAAGDPIITEGDGVTHLTYLINRPRPPCSLKDNHIEHPERNQPCT